MTLRTGTRAYIGRDPFNQNSNRSDREKVVHLLFFSKLFRLDRTDPLSFGPMLGMGYLLATHCCPDKLALNGPKSLTHDVRF